nr:phage tail protein [Pectobacterium zantedeschiae]
MFKVLPLFHRIDHTALKERKKGYRFQIDLNDGDNVDISISLQRTDHNLVRNENGALHVSYAPEPSLPEPMTRPTTLCINGELVSKWDE